MHVYNKQPLPIMSGFFVYFIRNLNNMFVVTVVFVVSTNFKNEN